MAKPGLDIEVIRQRVNSARWLCVARDISRVEIDLPSPYAPVTVHRTGAVTVTATGMRVFSLEETS